MTSDRVIRRAVGLYPGQYLRYPEVRLGEANLARLGIFETNQETGVRPNITVVEDTDSVFKDIIVNVKETHTGSIMFGAGINSGGRGLVEPGVAGRVELDGIPRNKQERWLCARVTYSLAQIRQGAEHVLSDIRAVEDLLGRTPIHLNENQIRGALEGKVVLVTGAAGSIGSELCRQIAGFRPAACFT